MTPGYGSQTIQVKTAIGISLTFHKGQKLILRVTQGSLCSGVPVACSHLGYRVFPPQRDSAILLLGPAFSISSPRTRLCLLVTLSTILLGQLLSDTCSQSPVCAPDTASKC